MGYHRMLYQDAFSRLPLKRLVKDFLIKARNLLKLLHSADFVLEHTDDFVAHGFPARRAEMDFDLVCGLTDPLHKVGLPGPIYGQGIGLINGFIGIHGCPFPARVRH
jgi:hypothetical protein